MPWERCQSCPLGGSRWRCPLGTSCSPDAAGTPHSGPDLRSAPRDPCPLRRPLQDTGRGRSVTSLLSARARELPGAKPPGRPHREETQALIAWCFVVQREQLRPRAGDWLAQGHTGVGSTTRTPPQVPGSCPFGGIGVIPTGTGYRGFGPPSQVCYRDTQLSQALAGHPL